MIEGGLSIGLERSFLDGFGFSFTLFGRRDGRFLVPKRLERAGRERNDNEVSKEKQGTKATATFMGSPIS